MAIAHRTDAVASVIDLITELVRIPSRDGLDEHATIAEALATWLTARGIESVTLRSRQGTPIGIYGQIRGARKGRAILLNATIDTAPFGDPTTWQGTPTDARVEDGWLYGRGAADSKAGVALYCQLLDEAAQSRSTMAGQLEFLFDLGEHSGQFTGVKAFLKARTGPTLDAAFIGYPGNSRIITGCRGFLRAVLRVHGESAHTGSRSVRGINAVTRAAELIGRFEHADLGATAPSGAFPLPAALTVTGVRGGESFSIVPDKCEIRLDVRLTPSFDKTRAEALIRDIASQADQATTAKPTDVRIVPGWPPYVVPSDHVAVVALVRAASAAFDRPIGPDVAGPSSAGNFLATRGIPAISGFGVTYRRLHGVDECIELASIAPTLQSYRDALIELLPR